MPCVEPAIGWAKCWFGSALETAFLGANREPCQYRSFSLAGDMGFAGAVTPLMVVPLLENTAARPFIKSCGKFNVGAVSAFKRSACDTCSFTLSAAKLSSS